MSSESEYSVKWHTDDEELSIANEEPPQRDDDEWSQEDLLIQDVEDAFERDMAAMYGQIPNTLPPIALPYTTDSDTEPETDLGEECVSSDESEYAKEINTPLDLISQQQLEFPDQETPILPVSVSPTSLPPTSGIPTKSVGM